MKKYIGLIFLLFFLMGAKDNDPCPVDMVLVGRFCIDKYEYPNIKGIKPMIGLSGLPEGNVNNWDIHSLCKNNGKRVCTSREWVKACRGEENYIYPWGNNRAHVCNTDKKYIAANETKVMNRDADELRKLDQSEPSGYRAKCKSTYGVYDLTGNVEEWVRCGWGKFGWCLAGRYWAGGVKKCSFMVSSHSPHWRFYETGGRCCLTPNKHLLE